MEKTIRITGEQLGALLNGIHTHAGLLCKFEYEGEDVMKDADEIVYREKDLLTVLEAIGLPWPVFKTFITVDEFKKQKKVK